MSQPKVSAAAFTTATERARLNPLSSVVLALRSFKRNWTGSAFAAAASSSMNDSLAKVTCGPLGSRRFPVRSCVSKTRGMLTTWVAMRRLGMAYMSEGVAAPPLAGVERPIPANWAIRTESGSL